MEPRHIWTPRDFDMMADGDEFRFFWRPAGNNCRSFRMRHRFKQLELRDWMNRVADRRSLEVLKCRASGSKVFGTRLSHNYWTIAAARKRPERPRPRRFWCDEAQR